MDPERAKALLRAVAPGAAERVARQARTRRGRQKKRDTHWRPGRYGEELPELMCALLDAPGAPVQMSRLGRSRGLDRNQLNTALGDYELRHVLPAFAVSLLATGMFGMPHHLHLEALQSETPAQARQTLGFHGPEPPLDLPPDDRHGNPAGRFVYLSATAVTDQGQGIPCSIAPVPSPQWRTSSWKEQVLQVAAVCQGPQESESEYVRRMLNEYPARQAKLAGRPQEYPVPNTMWELLLDVFASIDAGESAVGHEGLLTGLLTTGGWLFAPPAAPRNLGFAPLTRSLRPLRELHDAGCRAMLDLCAAAGSESTDLRSLTWTFVVGDTAYFGNDLHERLLEGQEPWHDVTASAPSGDGLRWHVARGIAREGVHDRPAALIATRDPQARRMHGLVRLSLDPLESTGSLRRALAVAHADIHAVRSPTGAMQAIKREATRLGALHLQVQGTPREPLLALTMSAVGSVVVSDHAPPPTSPS